MRRQPEHAESGARGQWFVRREIAGYGVILDAVTDAYISRQPIALFVTDTREGGTIERFRSGE